MIDLIDRRHAVARTSTKLLWAIRCWQEGRNIAAYQPSTSCRE